MSDGEYYAKMGYAALCRATLQLAEKARRENRKLPIWHGDHVIYGLPEMTPQQVAAANAAKPHGRA